MWSWPRTRYTSYISRIGSTNMATFKDMMLDHEEIEYIGTLQIINTTDKVLGCWLVHE